MIGRGLYSPFSSKVPIGGDSSTVVVRVESDTVSSRVVVDRKSAHFTEHAPVETGAWSSLPGSSLLRHRPGGCRSRALGHQKVLGAFKVGWPRSVVARGH